MRFDVGKSHGQRGLAGCSQWHRKESDMTESHTHTHTHTTWAGILASSLTSIEKVRKPLTFSKLRVPHS